MDYSPPPLSSLSDGHETAKKFGGLFRVVLCETVAKHGAHFQVVPVRNKRDWTRSTWLIQAPPVRAGAPRPVQLSDNTWLVAAQTLGIRPSERADGDLYLTTLKYVYQWQSSDRDDSWIIRWEYERGRADGKPASHVHVNGAPAGYTGYAESFGDLHIPAGRVGIEDVAAFLLSEVGTPRVSENAHEVIEEARQIFGEILGRRRG